MYELFPLFLVAFLWGVTNPLLKKGGTGIGSIQNKNKIIEIALKLKFIIFNWRCIVPVLINQGGSLLYFLTLSFTSKLVGLVITWPTVIFKGSGYFAVDGNLPL